MEMGVMRLILEDFGLPIRLDDEDTNHTLARQALQSVDDENENPLFED
jgi:hypothetical protein